MCKKEEINDFLFKIKTKGDVQRVMELTAMLSN